MNARDHFLEQEMADLLQPGETVLHTATAFQGSLLLASFFGALGQMLMLTHSFAVLTSKRLVLIKSRMGLLGVSAVNRGVTEIPLADVKEVRPGGLLNLRSLTLVHKDGSRTMFRYNSLVRQVAGQKAFCAEVPELLPKMIG